MKLKTFANLLLLLVATLSYADLEITVEPNRG